MGTIETVEANGITIAFERTGGGEPIVLLHGGEADHRMFASFVPKISPPLQVIAPDQRDSGGTVNPPDAYGMTDHADDCAALIGKLGFERATIMGISYGGMIAQEVAIRHPDRVARLILGVTTPGGALAVESLDDMIRDALARMQAEATMSREEKLLARARFFMSGPWVDAHPEVVDLLAGILVERTPDAAMRRGQAAVQHDTGDRLSRITAPTLVLYGTADGAISPENSRRIAGRIPDARLVPVEGSGHAILFEQPDACARIVLDFIRSTDGKGRA